MARACAERGCPTLPNGTTAQHCTACHETFGGTRAGDLHRVGPFPDGRRCLTPAGMAAAGLRLNDRGRWVTEWHGEPRVRPVDGRTEGGRCDGAT